MDKEIFEQNILNLTALNEEFGEERIFLLLNDSDEAQDNVRNQSTLSGTFAGDDPALIKYVRQLAAQYEAVVLLLNTTELSFDAFILPYKQIIQELFALQKEFGEEHIFILGNDAPKEFLDMLKQLSYVGSFPGGNSEIVTKVKNLAERHSSVIILLNPPGMEVFVTPNG